MVDTSLRLTLFLGFIKQFVIWTDPNSLLCYRAISSFSSCEVALLEWNASPWSKSWPNSSHGQTRWTGGWDGADRGECWATTSRGDKKETEKEIAPPPRKLKPPDQAAAEAEPSS